MPSIFKRIVELFRRRRAVIHQPAQLPMPQPSPMSQPAQSPPLPPGLEYPTADYTDLMTEINQLANDIKVYNADVNRFPNHLTHFREEFCHRDSESITIENYQYLINCQCRADRLPVPCSIINVYRQGSYGRDGYNCPRPIIPLEMIEYDEKYMAMRERLKNLQNRYMTISSNIQKIKDIYNENRIKFNHILVAYSNETNTPINKSIINPWIFTHANIPEINLRINFNENYNYYGLLSCAKKIIEYDKILMEEYKIYCEEQAELKTRQEYNHKIRQQIKQLQITRDEIITVMAEMNTKCVYCKDLPDYCYSCNMTQKELILKKQVHDICVRTIEEKTALLKPVDYVLKSRVDNVKYRDLVYTYYVNQGRFLY